MVKKKYGICIEPRDDLEVVPGSQLYKGIVYELFPHVISDSYCVVNNFTALKSRFFEIPEEIINTKLFKLCARSF